MSDKKFLSFELQKIAYEAKRLEWRIFVNITGSQSEIEKDYTVSFEFDPRPAERLIEDTLAEISSKEGNPSLLKEEDAKEIKNMKASVEKIKKQLKDDQATFPTITFFSYVREVKYESPTKVVFAVPADQINLINQYRMDLKKYALIMDQAIFTFRDFFFFVLGASLTIAAVVRVVRAHRSSETNIVNDRKK